MSASALCTGAGEYGLVHRATAHDDPSVTFDGRFPLHSTESLRTERVFEASPCRCSAESALPWTGGPTAAAAVPDGKSQLVKEIRQRDAQIRDLLARVEQISAERLQAQRSYQHRLEALEERLLLAHLVPVSSGPCQPTGPPCASLFEAERTLSHAVAPEIEAPASSLPPGAKVVAVHWLDQDHHAHHATPDPARQEPVAASSQPPPSKPRVGRVVESNSLVTPSPCHPVHWLVEEGFMTNVHPITRPPLDVSRANYHGRNSILEPYRAAFLTEMLAEGVWPHAGT